MPGAYTQLLHHIVFSTKHRKPQIQPAFTENLYAYIGGILRNEKATLLEAGGMPDHVHLYIRMPTDMALSHLMRTLKANSSKWVHQKHDRHFAWQEGYSAFTVSKSQELAVRRYIQTQAEHHAAVDFATELKQLLEKHGVEFDPRFVVD